MQEIDAKVLWLEVSVEDWAFGGLEKVVIGCGQPEWRFFEASDSVCLFYWFSGVIIQVELGKCTAGCN